MTTNQLARSLDTIPVVVDAADRDARFPSPAWHQRVENLDTRAVERYTGSAWVTDWLTGGLDEFALVPSGGDDTAIIQSVLTAAVAATTALVRWAPGTYTMATGVSVTAPASSVAALVLDMRGVVINYSGSGCPFTVTGNTIAVRWLSVYGGQVVGTSAGTGGWKLNDCNGVYFEYAKVTGFTNGYAFWLRNVDHYSENNAFLFVSAGASKRGFQFDPASVTGGGGVESFARTRVIAPNLSHNSEYGIYCQGGVYDAIFDRLSGNVDAGSTMVFLSGSMGGTAFRGVNAEGGGATASLFEIGTFTGTYPVVCDLDARSSMLEFKAGSDPTLLSAMLFQSGIRGGKVLTDLLGEYTSGNGILLEHDLTVKSGKGILGTAQYGVDLLDRRTAFANDYYNPSIWQTGQSGGTFPFDAFGHLMLQARSKTGLGRGVGIVTGETAALQFFVGADGYTYITSRFGCNGATPRAAATANAAVVTTAATQTTPYGYVTQAQADNLVTLLNQVRAALVANGIMV